MTASPTENSARTAGGGSPGASGPGPGAAPPHPGEEPPLRKLYRSSEGRLLGGVSRGLAGHLGLPVFWVRTVFVALALANGLGVLLYAAFWITVPLGTGGVGAPPSAPAPHLRPHPHTGGDQGTDGARRRGRLRRPDKGQVFAFLTLLLAMFVFADNFQFGRANTYLVPALLIGLGAALVWRQADDARRAHWAEVTRRSRLLPLARSAVGVLLVAVGVSGIVVVQGSAGHLGPALQAALAIVVGIALLSGPYLVRMMQDLSEERLMRIRAQERAELAAHVHDSVLHTLTLIQRNAESPREVARLARAQERELRTWLYKPGTAAGPEDAEAEPATLAESVRRTAAEVEDYHGVPVEVVSVGDCPLDEKLGAQVQAAREAMVNAAKYGGEGGTVQVYAEVEGESVFISVRDRGPGFDPDTVPEDRMGVRESIIGRMRRNGGTARLRSAPGEGTEVELEMEREAGRADKRTTD
ncbi:ATP-binding protein [Streptomyces sp. HNM0574]|uniref:ATP-binding protein n=1 Tax=Streptomyces sp. HNM0574 TaxID=2714954 RepID=UPI00146D391B|nr:ATP-binding protein [Streptomyces sp. HNM0574]NLU66861.1 PspC domain-containing protein [Streptomyces sp. HNM0574]